MTLKENKNTKHLKGSAKFVKDWIEPLIIALIIALPIRSFIIQPFKIPSGSMEDTLLVGDHLMVGKFIYGIKIPFTNKFVVRFLDPKPGEVIVFRYPLEPSKPFIKRCIAVEGQRVEIRNKKVFVDGKNIPLTEHAKFIDPHIYPATVRVRDNFGPIFVPEGHMFVMGDNRDKSNDSRYWGYVPYDNIMGKAFIIWWSWNHEVSLYDIIHKVRWERIFTIIR